MQGSLALPKKDTEHERVLGIVFDLSPAQASVLSALARGTVATSDELLKFASIKTQLKVVVSRTRAKLRTHGIDINSRIGVGYWIDKEGQDAIELAVRK